MKAILEFNLPDDESSFLNATRADNMVSAIDEFRDFLRKQIKYLDNQQTTYELIQTKFLDILCDNNLRDLS